MRCIDATGEDSQQKEHATFLGLPSAEYKIARVTLGCQIASVIASTYTPQLYVSCCSGTLASYNSALARAGSTSFILLATAFATVQLTVPKVS
ncbi:hypothetical protein PVAP13_1NG116888 [Panicum virgatum]|uniref:Uncharacterized protein n=1 Tax=Panicum virgatum TaxID=38727 RepID=A0A8T0WW51_PANVG|nr:hypothetical protein PVAP13_1NG116888 [Panicum virgatum]